MNFTNTKTSTTEIMSATVTLNKDDLLRLMTSEAILTQPGWEIISATCQIPSGGDCSGTIADIDIIPITVKLMRTT